MSNYKFRIARVGAHFWEEPPISGDKGSGTIFFSGCVLKCKFCQNYPISQGGVGVDIDDDQLYDIILKLQDEGVHNINLVTPSHYITGISHVLERVKPRLDIPVVYNTGSYERVSSLKMLDGLVDIYLPDYKYADDELAVKYSNAPNYTRIAHDAISEMRRQQPIDEYHDDIMKKGLIVRHLVLPGHSSNSQKVMYHIASIDPSMTVSIMSQYFPTQHVKDNYPDLDKRITQEEYDDVISAFEGAGLSSGFVQDIDSAVEDYVPDFDLSLLDKYIKIPLNE